MTTQKLIFIVDDDPFINTLIIKRFASEGYHVESFENGEDCLEALNKNPDLIILDYFFVSDNKELMNGMEVFERIKEIRPKTPVIMLSCKERN
jgi:CheY-like chemotaxis protein